MKGTIVNYRRGVTTQKNNQMIILPKDISDIKESEQLVGKTVKWTSPAKKEILGKVSALHGRKGAVRVIFEKGMPGQAIATEVEFN
jgi:large subunit ribosomal protein L35Ae